MALILGAALGLAAADFLVVTLEADLLVEVGLAGELDAADMDDNNVEFSTVQSRRTYIRSQYCISVAVLTFIVDRLPQRVDATRHVIQL